MKKIKHINHKCFTEENKKRYDGEINTCFEISSAISSAIPVPAFNRKETTVRKNSQSDRVCMNINKNRWYLSMHLYVHIRKYNQ